MAIVQCKECGGEVSSKAGQCPHCGNPLNVKRSSGCASVVLLGVLLLVLVAAFSDKDTRKSVAALSPSATPAKPLIASSPECVKYESALQRNGAVSFTNLAYPQSCTESEVGRYRVVDGVFRRKLGDAEGTYSLYFVGDALVKSEVGSFVDYHDVGSWELGSYEDSLTQKMVYIAKNVAGSGASKWGKPIVLWVRCKDNATDVFIDWGEYLGDDSLDVYDDWKWVSERLGGKAVVKRKWGVSTDKKALFYRPGGSAYKFAASLVGADQYVAATTPYNENPRTAVFNLAGVEAALAPVRDACGW